jgi:hypothetical protein
MVNAVIHYTDFARHRVLAIDPIGDRDAFMRDIRLWITATPVLIPQNPGVNQLTIQNVALRNTNKNVTISWTFDAAQRRYIVTVEDYQPYP